ncbi:MAG: hypothetical protein F6J89_10325 [Symploca sp. SIO1C4]|uniref:Uncharacterized protein n=1 Tax=Symploca sp. SIO1C4 TaxID=2607765 RepID=A0A6B3NED8_9CYAN|nr:hypothetical protein [Symploca sp. SIO1C4]
MPCRSESYRTLIKYQQANIFKFTCQLKVLIHNNRITEDNIEGNHVAQTGDSAAILAPINFGALNALSDAEPPGKDVVLPTG